MEAAFAVATVLFITVLALLNGAYGGREDMRYHRYTKPRVYKRWKERR
jgi:hypothetical protein